MIWFLQDRARLDRERIAIEALQEGSSWLKGAVWGLSTGLHVDADIEAHGHVYAVRMVYPSQFPASPPTVKPRDVEGDAVLWSSHQFGAGGELCLEWGPDTWMPEVTGAQMLESAYRLFELENPKGRAFGTRTSPAPSRHSLTEGQAMRFSVFRFFATAELRALIEAMPVGTHGELDTAMLYWQDESASCFATAVRPDGGDQWEDANLPPRLVRTFAMKRRGLFAKTSLPSSSLAIETVDDLQRVLTGLGNAADRLAAIRQDASSATFVLLQDADGKFHGFHASATSAQAWRYDILELPPDRPWERLGGVEGLATKRVGIVGLGSAGSKIALTLARSGVTRFVLIDDDLFLPENLIRHTLDWRNVGEHKVVAVASQLALISAAIAVEVRRIRTTGQESTATVAGALHLLADCDLIIDATADPATFNQLAMVTTQNRRSMVWLEVFSGGIGGLVARHRPGRDPDPYAMRAALNAFTTSTADQAAPPRATIPYGTEPAVPGQAPLVASDADVAAIALEAARMALDILAEREPSAFPASMYLIGLARGWIFDQPFHTIPIDVGPPGQSAASATATKEAVADSLEFLSRLIGGDAGGRADS